MLDIRIPLYKRDRDRSGAGFWNLLINNKFRFYIVSDRELEFEIGNFGSVILDGDIDIGRIKLRKDKIIDGNKAVWILEFDRDRPIEVNDPLIIGKVIALLVNMDEAGLLLEDMIRYLLIAFIIGVIIANRRSSK